MTLRVIGPGPAVIQRKFFVIHYGIEAMCVLWKKNYTLDEALGDHALYLGYNGEPVMWIDGKKINKFFEGSRYAVVGCSYRARQRGQEMSHKAKETYISPFSGKKV